MESKNHDNPFSVYLDQGIISRFRKNNQIANAIEKCLEKQGMTCFFVFSDVHAREIARSNRPAEYVEALEALDAVYLFPTITLPRAEERSTKLQSGIVRQKIPLEADIFLRSQWLLEELTRLLATFDKGGLGFLEPDVQLQALVDAMEIYIEDFSNEIRILCGEAFDPTLINAPIKRSLFETVEKIKELDIKQLDAEARQFIGSYSTLLPCSQGELDDIPAEEIAGYLIAKIPDQQFIENTYPRGFGARELSAGTIASFAMFLYNLGVSRIQRPRKAGPENFVKRYVSQFCDCEHIEKAAQCHMFVTADKRAARLAKATYAYAGISTQVCHVKFEQTQ